MRKPILEVDDLQVQLIRTKQEPLTVLNQISFKIFEGEIVGIVGESGCGKSVLSQSILGLQPNSMRISSGEILYEGQAIHYKNKRQLRALRGKNISMVFQNPMSSLNPSLTIGYQVSEMFRYHLHLSKKEAQQKTIELLQSVGLTRASQLIRNYPHELSGGMQQRIMIAIALACEPKLLIADEPTTALDVTIQAQILALMKNSCQQRNTAVLLVSHDLGVMANMCDHIIVMYAGEIVESGPTEQIIHQAQHPYTQGLIQSSPTSVKRGERLYTIPGIVPKLEHRSAGCAFVSRCPYATELCELTKPATKQLEGKQLVKCHFINEGAEQNERNIVANS